MHIIYVTLQKSTKEDNDSSKSDVKMDTEEVQDVKEMSVKENKKSTPKGSKKKGLKNTDEVAPKGGRENEI